MRNTRILLIYNMLCVFCSYILEEVLVYTIVDEDLSWADAKVLKIGADGESRPSIRAILLGKIRSL